MGTTRDKKDAIWRDFLVNLAAGLVVPLLVLVISLLARDQASQVVLYSVLAALVLAGAVAWHQLRSLRRRLTVLRAGLVGYDQAFPIVRNTEIWADCDKDFRYLGVSAHSFLNLFEQWVNESDPGRRYEFLLSDPDPSSRGLFLQKCHELDYNPSRLDTAQQGKVEAKVEEDRASIIAAVKKLKNLRAYAENRLSIRYHQEVVSWWVFELDEHMHVGILTRGRPGYQSPLLSIKKDPNRTNLFHAFQTVLDNLWDAARADT